MRNPATYTNDIASRNILPFKFCYSLPPSLLKLPYFPVLLLLLLSSCYTPRYVYSPAAQNVPMFTQKGDSKLGILYSSNAGGNHDLVKYGNQSSNGLDIQAAYALSKHWAVQGNYFYRHEQNSDDNNTPEPTLIRYNRHLTEAAIGYFAPVNESHNIIFQGYAGAGFGRFRFKDYQTNGNDIQYRNFHSAGIFKLFLQPVLMYQDKKQYAVSVSSRFSFIDYRKIKTDYDSSQLALYELNALKKGLTVFWEPAIVFTYGFKKLPYFRLEAQAGVAALLNKKFVDTRTMNASIGIQADLVNWFRPKPVRKK
ncbi:MAG: hypothetical protein QM687_17360 [Ferruginibacter sp.]